MYDRDGTFYRPPLNPRFVSKVIAKRKRELREAEIAFQVEEMARVRALKDELARERMERMGAELAQIEARHEELALERMERMAAELTAREALERERVPIPRIIKMVAATHGVKAVDVTGATRRREVVRARFEAVVMVAEARPEWSLNKVGRVFNRDHTSILHALKVMNAWPRKAA